MFFGLSGGEKQILALASIYAVNPDIYVLDEPTANIDKDGIDRLHEILLKLKQMGKTIVISEHRLYFLMDLVDKAVYIEHGVIQKVYTGDEFRALADSERIRLGLRCFTLDNEKDEVPTKCNSGILEIDNLSVSYKIEPFSATHLLQRLMGISLQLLDAMEVESPLFCVCFVGL